MFFFFFSSRRRHTRFDCDWSSDMCSSDLGDRALENNTSGSNNTALGSGALFSNDTGSQNVALGALAGVNLTTGDNNIDIGDRKSTRLNSSHSQISYAVFCLKKKKSNGCTSARSWSSATIMSSCSCSSSFYNISARKT